MPRYIGFIHFIMNFLNYGESFCSVNKKSSTVKFGDKEQFDKEQIGLTKLLSVTNLPVYFIRIRNIWY